jgi:hypothetical protein
MEQKYFVVTMHDGCLTLERYKTAIMNKLKELLKVHTGYSVGVEEKKSLLSSDDTSVDVEENQSLNLASDNPLASVDMLFDMEEEMKQFEKEYAPLQKRASAEARRNYSRNCQKKDWREWRRVKEQIDTLCIKYSEPIKYSDRYKKLRKNKGFSRITAD